MAKPKEVQRVSDRLPLRVSSPVQHRPNRGLTLVALVAISATVACSSSSPTAPTTSGSISALSLSASAAAPGMIVTGTITLSGAAPSEGASVILTSSDISAATVPATVTVPVGSTTQTFPIATAEVSSVSSTTITATYGGTSQTATLAVGLPVLQSLSLSASSASGGTVLTGTLTLGTAAPAGTSIALTSNSGFAIVPATVTVGEGSTSQTFEIQIIDPPNPSTATLTASYAGVTLATSLTVEKGTLQSLTGIPAELPGGMTFQATVTLKLPAPSNGATVLLSSSNSAVTVPGAVTIPAGATTGMFDIVTTNPPLTVETTITATYSGVSRSATMSVIPHPDVLGMTCSPSSVVGGSPVECVGTLRSPAPTIAWTLALTSSDSSFNLPQRLTVPAGSSSFQFTVTTTSVSSGEWVGIEVCDAASGLTIFRTAIYVTTS